MDAPKERCEWHRDDIPGLPDLQCLYEKGHPLPHRLGPALYDSTVAPEGETTYRPAPDDCVCHGGAGGASGGLMYACEHCTRPDVAGVEVTDEEYIAAQHEVLRWLDSVEWNNSDPTYLPKLQARWLAENVKRATAPLEAELERIREQRTRALKDARDWEGNADDAERRLKELSRRTHEWFAYIADYLEGYNAGPDLEPALYRQVLRRTARTIRESAMTGGTVIRALQEQPPEECLQ